MTPKDYFGLIVRTVGLLLLVASGYYFVQMLVFIKFFGASGFYTGVLPMFVGAVSILASLYLLRGAPHLMEFSYPNQPTTPPKVEEKTGW